jgi:hypothetical protein
VLLLLLHPLLGGEIQHVHSLSACDLLERMSGLCRSGEPSSAIDRDAAVSPFPARSDLAAIRYPFALSRFARRVRVAPASAASLVG